MPGSPHRRRPVPAGPLPAARLVEPPVTVLRDPHGLGAPASGVDAAGAVPGRAAAGPARVDLASGDEAGTGART